MVQEMNARMGVVTERTASLYRRGSLQDDRADHACDTGGELHEHRSGFAGIAASSEIRHQVLHAVPIAAAGIWYGIKGSYQIVEKPLVVSLVYVAYIISAFLAKPDWSQVARGFFVPSGSMSASFIVMVITIVGTTIAPWMQFYQQSSIVDKGLSEKDLLYERADTGIGTVFLVITAS
jgi:Mn2+/Fe2+ NRAMP family transporter